MQEAAVSLELVCRDNRCPQAKQHYALRQRTHYQFASEGVKSMFNLEDLTKEQRWQIHAFENEILELIDEQDKYTRSDLQGRVAVIVANILRAGKNF